MIQRRRRGGHGRPGQKDVEVAVPAAALPRSNEAEAAVLGAVIMGNTEALEEALFRCHPEDFNVNHRLIWEAIAELVRDSKAVDMVTVSDKLRASGRLDDIGGVSYLSDLTLRVPTGAHTQHWCDVLTEKRQLRELMLLGAELQQRSASENSKELLEEIERRTFQILSSTRMSENQLASGCKEFLEQIDARENSGVHVYPQTSLRVWNEIFGGIMPKTYGVVGGRPGAGKTALAEQFVDDLCRQGIPCGYISIELTRDRAVSRLAARRAQQNLSYFLRSGATRDVRQALREATHAVSKYPLHLTTPTDTSGMQMRTEIRRMHRALGVQFVVIDYIQLTHVPAGMEKRDAIADASTHLRHAVKETGVALMVLVQLNRNADRSDRPRMSDIKDCGQVEQDADYIALLSQDDKKEPDPMIDDEALERSGIRNICMNVDKNRWGAVCEERLVFHGAPLTFHNKGWSLSNTRV